MNLLPFGVGCLFALGSLYFLARSLHSLTVARKSLSWPSVEGHIRKSEAVRFQSTSNHRALFVEYEYTVDGVSYTGTRDAFYTLRGDEAAALERAHQASPAVRVHYAPDDPRNATLIVGPRAEKPYSDLILSVLGLVVGLALAVGAYRGYLG